MKRALLLLLLFAGCHAPADKPPTLTVLVKAPVSVARELGRASWSPRAPVLSAERIGTTLALVLDARRAPQSLHLDVPGACPLDVPLGGKPEVKAKLAAWLDPGDEQNDVGFDKDVELELRPGCRQAVAGRITWKQIAGPHLSTRTLKNGFVLLAHTLPLSKLHPSPLPWGVVPFSPRTRGAYAFEATWSDGRRSEKQIVRFASAPRARGVTSVATDQRVYLGGAGWTLDERPRGSRAALSTDAGLASFFGDERGDYVFHDGDGQKLVLQVGRFDVTPLDCGRSRCHAKQGEGVKTSPMTSVLERDLDGKATGRVGPCVLACHAVGEPGQPDGGFVAVARQLGWVFPEKPAPGTWNGLPRALRRLGSVGCTGCHSAGAIPKRSMRWAILRADVCANCHDAPPRYGHVVAWRQSRMARSDADPRTRSGQCAECHTTAGFLGAHGLRDSKSMPPANVTLGIACAACHAPHGAHEKTALLRKLPLPAGFEHAAVGEASVCLGCHAARKGDNQPASSAGNLVFEVGPVAAGPKPMHALVGGCIACHSRTPKGSKELGTGHTFRTRPASCTSCHKGGAPPMRDFRKRASALLVKLGAGRSPDKGPLHATDETTPSDQQRAHALAAVRLVLEDPAAGAHNPGYAKRLLDFAEARAKH